MKSLLRNLALQLIAFSLVATGCSKADNPRDSASLKVNCIRTNTNPDALPVGTEIVVTRHESGDRYANFTMVPSTMTFEDLKPGTYDVYGLNSNSNERVTIQLGMGKVESAELSFSE